ncbi:hypothetical protein PH210_05740 [Paenibacillus sp. BSR1-1]|uniref:hypothetical protein n=1 Tax=Paenibacillus sp. BSR1-1 TaxID=3020845 RepID=UPI0025B0E8AC|nr:hypothetical protein [Paenibacillus sp. BSR1-1]MDN3015710.1 hypothetical protein [Paenibacillus sp. BSR1-1]
MAKHAFRAFNLDNQVISRFDDPTKILFPMVEFDLGHEYDPTTSTFVPSANGIYSICAGLYIDPLSVSQPVDMAIRVNGTLKTFLFGEPSVAGGTIVMGCNILQLSIGDKVDIIMGHGSDITLFGGNDRFYFTASLL